MSPDADEYYPKGLNARFKFDNLSHGGLFYAKLDFRRLETEIAKILLSM